MTDTNRKADDCLSLYDGFWTAQEKYASQRVTTKQWRNMLLEGKDTMIKNGRIRKIVAKRLGAGVLELRLAPLKDD